MNKSNESKLDPPLGQVNIAFDDGGEGNSSLSAVDNGKKNESDFTVPAEGLPDAPSRETWDKPLEFLLSCIAMSVGLGNIWRFPFIAYANGGGAFLIPYLIVLTLIGRPMYFLELCLGQFSSFGQVKVWNVAPTFKGVGYVGMIGTICTISFYSSVMGLTVFYFSASFQKNLPWDNCNEDWVGLGRGGMVNNETGIVEPFLQCNEDDPQYAYEIDTGNRSTISLPQLYYENEVLHQKDQIDDGLGAPEYRLTLCLLFTWLLIWGAMIKGVKSSGKVAYFTALFPYFVLIIMLIRAVTLPGAWKGIELFITPDWELMGDPKVWYEAVGQMFFSLTTTFGPIIMFASYNKFNQNIYRDAWIISGMDTFTSLLAGFTCFAVLGSLSEELGVEVKDVVNAGPGLVFVSYPAGIARFGWTPQLFSVLFYLMLFTLGIGSATSMVGCIVTIVCDQWPKLSRWKVTTVICALGFLSGLIYTTPGGQFMVELVSNFGTTFIIYVIAILEVAAVAWAYGVNKFIKDIEFMLGVRIGWYWKFCWGGFMPIGLTVVLIYQLVNMERLSYEGRPFPDSAIGLGWGLAGIALAIVPLCAIHTIKTRKAQGLKEKIKEAFKPTSKWGPMKPSDRVGWVAFKSKAQ